MREFEKIYNSIESPIKDSQRWRLIVDSYSKSIDYDEFYHKLMHLSGKNKNAVIDIESRDAFLASVATSWKNKVLSLSATQIELLKQKQMIDADFDLLIEELKKFNTINTLKDYIELISSTIIYKYYRKFFFYKKGVNTINSYFNVQSLFKLKYALCVNVDIRNLYKLLRLITLECERDELNYYIRYVEKNEDAVVYLYANRENLEKYADLLKRVRKDNLAILPKNLKPPILMGVVKEWIGCCSLSYDDYDMYNDFRAKIIFKALDETMYYYVIRNMDKVISYKAGKISIKDYIAYFVADNEIERLIKSAYKDKAQKFYGAKFDEINDTKVFFRTKLLENIEDILRNQMNLNDLSTTIDVVLKNKRTMRLSAKVFMFAIRKLVQTLTLKDGKLEQKIKDAIKHQCSYYEIDPIKFCFDKQTHSLINYDTEGMEEINSIVDEMNHVASILDEVSVLQKQDEYDEILREKIANNIKEALAIMNQNQEA